MAEVPITINGVICDLYGRTITGPVKIVGSAMLTDVGVGGGPIIPPDGGGGGIKPPDKPNYPAFPIVGWPGSGFPDKPGYPPTVEHPIVIPKPPTEPPPDGGGGGDSGSIVKPPPPEGGWGWSPEYGWGWFPGTDNPGPKG